MKSAKHITVLLAEDHLIVREGLFKLLSEEDIEVVGEATNGRQAVLLAKQLRPAVVVMDIAMPLLNGLEATRQILQAAPGSNVLILSAYSDAAYIEQAIAFGAKGFMLKHVSARDLCTAIREIEKGNTFFCPLAARKLRHLNQKSLDRKGQLKTKLTHLSSRELEVLQLIAEGAANKQVADELNISIKTVEKHREHLMQKLNIHETAGLTRYAIETGVIESSVQMTIS